MTTKKFLCVCDYGNVRSVAMAGLIKSMNHQEKQGDETMKYFTSWADAVIDMTSFLSHDIWNSPTSPELIEECVKIWRVINVE